MAHQTRVPAERWLVGSAGGAAPQRASFSLSVEKSQRVYFPPRAAAAPRRSAGTADTQEPLNPAVMLVNRAHRVDTFNGARAAPHTLRHLLRERGKPSRHYGQHHQHRVRQAAVSAGIHRADKGRTR